MQRSTCFAVLMALSLPALAHHSFAEYDFAATEELDGEIASVFWRNPHVRITLRVRDARGSEQTWELEAQDVNSLGRRGLSATALRTGDRVKVAGNPSRQRERALFVTNLLLPSGTEIRLRGEDTTPRWSTQTAGFVAPQRANARPEALEARGLFRVWLRPPGGDPALARADLLLTPAARAALERWDPADDPALRCIGPAMPGAMYGGQIHPIELVERDGDILVRIEAFDRVRTIYMSDAAAERSPSPTALGHSVGRWEGETLVVRTTHIANPLIGVGLFGGRRLPLGAGTVVEERFSAPAGTDELIYEYTITDPTSFTEPFSSRWVFDWHPELVIESYECTLGE